MICSVWCGCDPGRLLLAVLAALGWVQHPPVLPGITVLWSMTPLPLVHTHVPTCLYMGAGEATTKIKIYFKVRAFGGEWS